MAIALFTFDGLFARLQTLLRAFAARHARQQARETASGCQQPRAMPAVPAAVPRARPLRVVRVFEGPQPRAAAGRMVISGRLADVCAELDRMAAVEAAS
ncbi:hypothetical protein [Ramlibacter sp.]|uniref:hypothetical protein n=1 Tax=Ramlibacter sp. TaxID=1917967 RepID=UPI0017AB4418|nr:hypothetical protein [Ramlibacter sp.]MBA2675154.1 hypothetical protein [Ramlibacter sp.]